MRRTVGIIGMGWVGSSVAISILHSGAADELMVSDLRTELAEGEAMDLSHGAAFYPSTQVRTASVEEMVEADVVIVSAGRGGRAGETRLDLLRDNAAVVRDIGHRLSRCRGVVIIVTNPVDVLTSVMAKTAGLPASRVISTGTMLDTARFRQVIGRTLKLDPHSVHAQVIGEHGDSEVALWSDARVGGVPLRSWPGWTRDQESVLAKEVRVAAYEIIRRKGATNHAIGLVTADLVRSVLRDERRILTVSRVQDGPFGLHDVALSLPAIVGSDGAGQVLEPALDPDERERLNGSADLLRQAAASL